MLTVLLQHGGLDPSFVIGGHLNETGSNAHAGSTDLFVAELDESDGSFLLFSPFGAIVTNVELDHVARYHTKEQYDADFALFVRRIDPAGFLVTCADDPGSAALVAVAHDHGVRVTTYGCATDADVRVENLVMTSTGSTFDLIARGERHERVLLQVLGLHNAVNAAGAFAAALEAGMTAADARAGLEMFTGVRRRFDLRGVARGVRVYDDYGHNPAKIRAALSAARLAAGEGRLIVVFQPHRYSRTLAFGKELGLALEAADEVVIMDIYPEWEDPLPGASAATVVEAVPLPAERVHFQPSWSQVAPLVGRLARPGDLVVTLGAGDVTLLGPEILAELAARPDDGASA
jgi:UDP-N-acetylmuramate--alanine ligase